MYGQYSRAVSNQEWNMMAPVRQIITIEHSTYQFCINLSLQNQSLSFFRSGSGSSSGLTASSTNASSSEFSCDTVVYRGQSDGSGTDSEHPPTNMLLRTSRNGSLDEIPRPASSNGGRRRKILTNGAISPRQCLSPLPYLPRY